MLNGRTAGRLATEAMQQAVSEPSGYPGVAGLDGDCGLGSCSMEALVMECLQPRDGQEEPNPADSGVPDVPCPLLGAAQNSRSALLKGCSSITVGLRTSVRSEATSRRHAGPQLPWHFLYQWSQPGATLSPEPGMVRRRVFGRQGWRERCAAGTWCWQGRNAAQKSAVHTASPRRRAMPVSCDSSGEVEKPCSAVTEVNLFSIPDPETHFLTRV